MDEPDEIKDEFDNMMHEEMVQIVSELRAELEAMRERAEKAEAKRDALQARVRELEEDARILSNALIMPQLAAYMEDMPKGCKDAWRKLVCIMEKYVPKDNEEFQELKEVLAAAPRGGERE